MSNLELPSTEKNTHDQGLQLLEMKLSHALALLNDKRDQIAELENTIELMQRPKMPARKLTEEETQCSFEEDQGEEPTEAPRRLGQMLTTRENEGINLHLATEEMKEEIEGLKKVVETKGEEAGELRRRIQELQGYLIVSMRDFEFLCNENKTLRDRNYVLEKEKNETQRHLSELETEAEKWEELKMQKEAIMKQRMEMQCEENKVLRQREERLKDELQIQGDELERVRQALNSYDWKLFCLETELDLWAKECKQLKFTNQKQNIAHAEMESLLKEKQIAVFSQQEENKLLLQEKQTLNSEIAKKLIQIEQLKVQIDSLKQGFEEREETKDLTYSLKEKDEELNEIMTYLKEKINELDQVKKSNTFLHMQIEKNHLRRKQLQHQVNKFEQDIIEHEEIFEKQQKKIQQLQKTLENIRKQYQDNTFMQILRRSEWNQLNSELEKTVSELNEKINTLSLEIIQRDIVSKKNSERLANAELNLEACNKQLFSTFMKLEQTESLSISLQEESSFKEAELQRYQNKIKNLEQTLKEREKLLYVLKEEVKLNKAKNVKMNEIVQEYESDFYLKDEEISILQEEIGSLKEKMANQIETELNLEFRTEQVLKENERLKMAKEDLEQGLRKKELEVLEMKLEAKALLQISSTRIEEMMNHLKDKPQEIDETDKFEVLEEEDYQVTSSQQEKQRVVLKQIVEEYQFEVNALSRRLEM